MLGTFVNIFKIPDLRNKILFTVALLCIYRIGFYIPVPGFNQLATEAQQQGDSPLSRATDYLEMFTGGTLSRSSLFGLGIMPYISASIILMLLGEVIPSLRKLRQEGATGYKKIQEYTRYLTVPLCILQAMMYMRMSSLDIFTGMKTQAIMMGIVGMTAGTMFLMWLGESITDRGIGNGISLIIFAGIVARLPDAVVQTFSLSTLQGGKLEPLTLLVIGALIVATIGFIVFFERAQRRIPVQYAKKVVGRKLYGGQTTYLPLKVNTAGVIPPIFASSILMFPATLSGLFPGATWVTWMQNALGPGGTLYNTLYVVMIIFFAFFYTAVTFNPVDVADNLKKNGGFVPGIRAGKATADYIDRVLSRVTVGGAIYIAAICVLPTILQQKFQVPFYFGGTSLLIVVGVALYTAGQIEAHLISRSYEGFAGAHGPRVRGRRDYQ